MSWKARTLRLIDRYGWISLQCIWKGAPLVCIEGWGVCGGVWCLLRSSFGVYGGVWCVWRGVVCMEGCGVYGGVWCVWRVCGVYGGVWCVWQIYLIIYFVYFCVYSFSMSNGPTPGTSSSNSHWTMCGMSPSSGNHPHLRVTLIWGHLHLGITFIWESPSKAHSYHF